MLFSATVTEGMESIFKQISEKLAMDLPFIELFRILIESTIFLYLKNNKLARILLNELSAGIDSKVLAEIENVQQGFVDFIADLLKQGQDIGHLKPMDTRLVAIGIVGRWIVYVGFTSEIQVKWQKNRSLKLFSIFCPRD